MRSVREYFHKHPVLGMRTFKTMVAVILSSLFMRYVLNQNPFFACIGAVVATERTMTSSLKAAVIRNVGTLTGGVIGIIVASFTENIFIMALGLVPFIWINNQIHIKDSIVPGAIVYFAVFYLNTMETAWSYGLIRIMGTFIGTIIALAVNALIFPPKPELVLETPAENAEAKA